MTGTNNRFEMFWASVCTVWLGVGVAALAGWDGVSVETFWIGTQLITLGVILNMAYVNCILPEVKMRQ